MMNFKSVIVGLGNIAFKYDLDDYDNTTNILTHTKAIKHSQNLEIIAGVDTNSENRELFKSFIGVEVFSNFKGLKEKIDNPDLFVIASSTETHFEVITQVIKNFKPKAILCEKPISYNYEEIKSVFKLCDINKIKLFTNFPRRFEVSTINLKNHIKMSKIFKGTIWYSNGFINNGIHFIDLMNNLVGISVFFPNKTDISSFSISGLFLR